MAAVRSVWIVRASYRDRQSSESWLILTLEFRRALRCDAAAQVADAVRHGDAPSADYYTRKAMALRAASNSTTFYHPDDKAEFTLRFQANTRGWDSLDRRAREPSEWYAVSIDDAKVDSDVAKAIGKIAALPYESCASPAAVVVALRAVPAVYVDDAHEFAPSDAATFTAQIRSPLDIERAEQVAATDAA